MCGCHDGMLCATHARELRLSRPDHGWLAEVDRLIVDAMDSTDRVIFEKDWGSDEPSAAFRAWVHALTEARKILRNLIAMPAECGDEVISRILPGESLVCSLPRAHAGEHADGDGSRWARSEISITAAFRKKAHDRALMAQAPAKKPDTRPRCTAITRRKHVCRDAANGAAGLCTSHAASMWNRYIKQQTATVPASAKVGA